MSHTMKAAEGKIAERWAITYQLQRQVLRCFRGEPDEVVAAKRVMKLIEELSAAEERERVLREVLQTLVAPLDDKKRPYEGWAPVRALAKKWGVYEEDVQDAMDLIPLVARAALATPAPEQPSEQNGGSK